MTTEAARIPDTEVPTTPIDTLASAIVQELKQKLLLKSKASARVYSEFLALSSAPRSNQQLRKHRPVACRGPKPADSKDIKERRAWAEIWKTSSLGTCLLPPGRATPTKTGR
jgi:GTP cyclohydrolase FolE2